jgi:phage terminase small subunit
MRGRKPKPVEVKRREGNPGRRPLPEPVLIGGRAAPRMPSHLPQRAKTAWRQIVPRLDEVGMLDRVDGPALEALCVQVAIMRQATAEIAELDSLVTTGRRASRFPTRCWRCWRRPRTP